MKHAFVLGRSQYHRRYEPVWYGWAQGGTSSFGGQRDLDDVWEIVRPRRSEEHPTMVELPARAITNSSKPGENVLDLFGGSGSTLIAAEQVARKAFLMEPEMVQRTMGMLTAASLEAVKTLVALQDREQPAASRLGAARAILEYGSRLREEADIVQRLEALEQQLGADKGRRSA